VSGEPSGVASNGEDEAMLRLTGLPAVARYPHATVERTGDRILLVFAGDEGARQVDVDPRLVGEEDREGTELQLLARLQEIGYQVEWLRPDGRDDVPAPDDGIGPARDS
jgi:hypothetical protein